MTRPRPARTQQELLGSLMRQLHLEFVSENATVDNLPPTVLRNYIEILKPLRDALTISVEERETYLQNNPPPGMVFRKPPDIDDQPTEVHVITDVQEPVLSKLTLNAIQAEATRAHIVHGNESMFGDANSARRLAILVEEYGEAVEGLDILVQSLTIQMKLGEAVGRVAHHLTYDSDAARSHEARTHLVIELIQVAAMAASWVEVLEGKRPNDG